MGHNSRLDLDSKHDAESHRADAGGDTGAVMLPPTLQPLLFELIERIHQATQTERCAPGTESGTQTDGREEQSQGVQTEKQAVQDWETQTELVSGSDREIQTEARYQCGDGLKPSVEEAGVQTDAEQFGEETACQCHE